MKRIGFAMLLFLVGMPSALAQWHSRDGNTLPDESWRKHDKGFGAVLQIASQGEYERFSKEWYGTAVEHAPTLATADSAARGDSVMILVLYSGCAPSLNNAGSCDAMMDFRIVKPDGSYYLDLKNLPLAEGLPATSGTVQMSPIAVKILFEPEDPLGIYRVEVAINDPSQDAQVSLSNEITLMASKP